MGALIEKRLPWPPSINHYYRHTRNGHYITAEGRLFRAAVRDALGGAGADTLQGPLMMSVLLYPPDKRRRDMDNVLKALQDALQAAGVYADDCQIQLLCISKREQVRGGAAVVWVRPLEDAIKCHCDLIN